MLDRKTKDRDASIELLEDRQRENRFYLFVFYILWVFGSVALLIPNITHRGAYILIVASVSGIVMLATFLLLRSNRSILLYLKQNEKKDVVYIKRKEVKK